jgi:hypothetical protein
MFTWKDRLACLTRIVVTMKCQCLDVDAAIDRAIFKADKDGYSFCYHPEEISPLERTRLRSQAETYFIGKSIPALKWIPQKFERR